MTWLSSAKKWCLVSSGSFSSSGVSYFNPDLGPALLELEKVCRFLKLPRTHFANHVARAVWNNFYENAWLVDCLLERFGISPEYSRIQAAANCAMRFVIPSKCCVCFLIAIFALYTLYIEITILIETILPCLPFFFASSRERGGELSREGTRLK